MVVVFALAVTTGVDDVAAAHESLEAGGLRVTIGWRDEPAYAGVANAVQVIVVDDQGAPANDPKASLLTEVTFGDELRVLPLSPSGVRAGEYTAPLVPTRAGTYAFHVSGTVNGQTIDLSSTCSEQTFDCVTDAATLQFPVKDPSNGELAAQVEHALTERGGDGHDDRGLGVGATVVVAALAGAVASALTAWVLGPRRGSARSG